MLLRDYAITPDVFDATFYTSEETCGLHLDRIREVMLTEGLVRDLRSGEWRALFANDGRPWHRRGKELVKKLASQGRLAPVPSATANAPADDCAWCEEALATHRHSPLSGGIVVSERVKAAYRTEPIVAQIDRLPTTPWWTSRSPSVRLLRTPDDYRTHLVAVLGFSNSIQFIDPYLDPGRGGYQHFGELLRLAAGRDPAPLIEIHRVCWEDSNDKRFTDEFKERIESSFRARLGPVARSGLRIAIFLWDDFHDRYAISNIVGISVPYGFDTTRAPNSVTTWTRLGRNDRDDIQREFDPASGHHELQYRFEVP